VVPGPDRGETPRLAGLPRHGARSSRGSSIAAAVLCRGGGGTLAGDTNLHLAPGGRGRAITDRGSLELTSGAGRGGNRHGTNLVDTELITPAPACLIQILQRL
jgi:hypothetical protein